MRTRTLLFSLAVALLLAPLALVTAAALGDAAAWASWNEADRLQSLLTNTLALAALTGAIAVPAGTLAAIALERAAIPGAKVLRGMTLVALFVPLPVTAIAWQIVLGSWLPSMAKTPGDVAWRPWSLGLLPAAVVHAFAALPWVIVIVGAGLRTIDRELEEDALVLGGPAMALRRVLLPRVALAALAALAWVAVQTATEIAVTDAMMVRTFAEEVYTQIVGVPGGVHGAVVVTLPVLLAAIITATFLMKRLAKRFPNNPQPASVSRPLRWSPPTRAMLAGFAYLLFFVSMILPVLALGWKAAGGDAPSASLSFAVGEFSRIVSLNGRVLLQSLTTAALTGLVAAWLATALAWAARDSCWRANLLLVLAVVLALTPGPILGQGLKEMIQRLLTLEEWVLGAVNATPTFPPLRSLLYDQPSPLPTVLAGLLRFLPVALLIVTPVIRALPRDLLDQAKLDGASSWATVGRPATTRATMLAAVAVAALTLGDVGAGKLIAPPGWRLFILDLFDQMHYGPESSVAAMALVQIAATTFLLTAFFIGARSVSEGRPGNRR